MERLQKLIAASGLTSRRGAERLIAEGRVSLNGERVTDLATRAELGQDAILVNGRPLPVPSAVTYALNKPRGVVCSRRQQGKERLVTDLVPAQPSVYPVGRLDKESEGLILLTNQGELANRLTHPSFAHGKEYVVEVRWQKDALVRPSDWVARQLLKGVRLGDGPARADRAEVRQAASGRLLLTLEVHEGRQHLIRRMCATMGLDVLRLTRTRLAGISLRGLRSGQYRTLTEAEVKKLLA